MQTVSYIYKLTLLEDFGPFRKGAVYVGQSGDINKSYFTGGSLPQHVIKAYGKAAFKKETIVSGHFNSSLLNQLERHYIQLYASNVRGFNINYGGSVVKPAQAYELICAYDFDGNKVAKFTNRLDALSFVNQGTWFGKIKNVMDKPNASRFGYQWRSYEVDNCGAIPQRSSHSGCPKPVVEIDESGKVIGRFLSVAEAGRLTGISDSALSESCIKSVPTKGRTFRFERDYTKNVSHTFK